MLAACSDAAMPRPGIVKLVARSGDMPAKKGAARVPRARRQAAAANVVVSEIAFHSRQRRHITDR